MNKTIGTTELAKLLGVSRIAVHKQIKSGKITASKSGRNYRINSSSLPILTEQALSSSATINIQKSVTRTVKQYREALELLGKE